MEEYWKIHDNIYVGNEKIIMLLTLTVAYIFMLKAGATEVR
jgi:hypothetical protein